MNTTETMHVPRSRRGLSRAMAFSVAWALTLLGTAADAQHVTIIAGGDVVIHRSVAAAATAHAAQGGFEWVLDPLRSELPSDAVAFANLESPLSERYRPPGNFTPPVLGAEPTLAAALGAVGFDVVSIANNHAYDQTADGLYETMEALRAAHVAFAGAGHDAAEADAVTVIERNGVRIGVVAFTDRVNEGPGSNTHGTVLAATADPARVAAALRAARSRADVVVLSIHWSHDFVYSPTATQRTLARTWVDAGADLILGTGPHVLQPVERMTSPRGDAIVAWSIGNLLSNQGYGYRLGTHDIQRGSAIASPFARDGALLRVGIERRPDRTIHVTALEAVPLWTEHNGEGHLRAAPLRNANPATRAERRAAIGAALGSAVTLRD